MLLAAHALVASFLGAAAIRAHGLHLWGWLAMIARNKAFIIPVCVDGTPESIPDLPESFLRVQWTRLAAGATLLGLAACAAEETPPPAPPPPPQYQAQVIYGAPAPPPAPTAVSYNAAMFPVAAAPIGQVGSTGGESWRSSCATTT